MMSQVSTEFARVFTDLIPQGGFTSDSDVHEVLVVFHRHVLACEGTADDEKDAVMAVLMQLTAAALDGEIPRVQAQRLMRVCGEVYRFGSTETVQ